MPQKGQLFLAIGQTKKELTVHKVTKNGHFGMTPHIITFDHIKKDGRIAIYVSCAIVGCGWSLTPKDDDGANVSCDEARLVVMEALEYAALKKYRDDSYFLD